MLAFPDNHYISFFGWIKSTPLFSAYPVSVTNDHGKPVNSLPKIDSATRQYYLADPGNIFKHEPPPEEYGKAGLLKFRLLMRSKYLRF